MSPATGTSIMHDPSRRDRQHPPSRASSLPHGNRRVKTSLRSSPQCHESLGPPTTTKRTRSSASKDNPGETVAEWKSHDLSRSFVVATAARKPSHSPKESQDSECSTPDPWEEEKATAAITQRRSSQSTLSYFASLLSNASSPTPSASNNSSATTSVSNASSPATSRSGSNSSPTTSFTTGGLDLSPVLYNSDMNSVGDIPGGSKRRKKGRQTRKSNHTKRGERSRADLLHEALHKFTKLESDHEDEPLLTNGVETSSTRISLGEHLLNATRIEEWSVQEPRSKRRLKEKERDNTTRKQGGRSSQPSIPLQEFDGDHKSSSPSKAEFGSTRKRGGRLSQSSLLGQESEDGRKPSSSSKDELGNFVHVDNDVATTVRRTSDDLKKQSAMLVEQRRTFDTENTTRFGSRKEPSHDTDDAGHISISTQPDNLENFTNEPHPALETPLLYFLLKRHPRMLSGILCFYSLRWDITYVLQNRLPGTRCLQRLKIIITWGEVFLLVPFALLALITVHYTFVHPDVNISGHVARTPLIFAFLTAMKNNIFTFVLGMSVERSIKYHKMAAFMGYISSILHTYVAYMAHVERGHMHSFLFGNSANAGGTMLLVVMTFMFTKTQPFFRANLFELFYWVHIVCAVGMMGCAFYHTGLLIPVLGSCTWGLDVVVRKVYMPFFRYPRKAKLCIISDSVVEMSFLKQDGLDFNPGQYIYIAVPKLGILEWHPFSLSSSPKQKIVTVHIRVGGNWTTALYDLAKKQKEVDILMEGPYGSICVDIANPYKYQTVMLFSGGIGVTPMQSLCNSLMYEHNHETRKLRKLSFVWIERDPVMMPEVDVVRRESSRHPVNNRSVPANDAVLELSIHAGGDGATTLARQLLSQIPAGRDTDCRLRELYQSTEFGLPSKGEAVHIENPRSPYMKEDDSKAWRKGLKQGQSITSLNDESFLDHAFRVQEDQDDNPIDLQVYLTNKKLSRAARQNLPLFATIGRPDIDNLFRQARRDALKNHQQYIAVCVCAPQRIVDLCHQGCAKYSDRYVTFDFHSELFS